MSIFGKKKTVIQATPRSTSQAAACPTANLAGADGAAIKVLGSGCAKCQQLEEATRAAVLQLGWNEPLEHVTDFAQIAAFGVMSTPALVVDGKVLSYGKVLKPAEVVELLQKARPTA